jgi:two-component system sensor histidine kinase DctS
MPYWLPDEIEATLQRHRRTLAGGAPREGYEATWRHRSGRLVHVMVFEAPLIDDLGRHIGWMGSVLDITERKEIEARERRQVETLAHHARLATLGEIASTLAHELNQPLTVMASYSAGLRNALAARGERDHGLLEAAEQLGEQAAAAGRIVNRIREFLSRRAPQPLVFDLRDTVSQAAELLARDLRERGASVALLLPTQRCAVRGDRVLVEQVAVNLLRNGAEATRGAAPARIEVRIEGSTAGGARLDVLDNGPGLQGRTLEQLCQPFFSTRPEGMGLGLAICRSIVESHQGQFRAQDREGGGACFTVIFPPTGDDSGDGVSLAEAGTGAERGGPG